MKRLHCSFPGSSVHCATLSGMMSPAATAFLCHSGMSLAGTQSNVSGQGDVPGMPQSARHPWSSPCRSAARWSVGLSSAIPTPANDRRQVRLQPRRAQALVRDQKPSRGPTGWLMSVSCCPLLGRIQHGNSGDSQSPPALYNIHAQISNALPGASFPAKPSSAPVRGAAGPCCPANPLDNGRRIC